jgi:signal transduction histidine kinase
MTPSASDEQPLLSRQRVGSAGAPAPTSDAFEGSGGARAASNWVTILEHKSRSLVVGATIASIALVGLLDYGTQPEFSFSVFYLAPVAMAAWLVGPRLAYMVAIACVTVSVLGDLASGSHYASSLAPLWNGAIILAFYAIVVSLLTRLRAATVRLEARIQERTVKLTEEMAERERLERELIEVSERERRRVGHDLHDSLGQHLTATALAAQVLEEKLAARAQPEARDAGRLVGLIEDGAVLSRRLANTLHPIEMDAGGLMQALEELAAATSELFKISCRFECDSPVLVADIATSGHLYRIAQEAVSNAVKHGRSRNVTIELQAADEGVCLAIRDDGIGLPDLRARPTGMGLRIMAHRARMIGASFAAERGSLGGTAVTCVLPYAEPLHSSSS